MKPNAIMSANVMDSQSIMNAFRDIRERAPTVTGDKEGFFETVYPDFKLHFPYLFHKSCTDPTMDEEKLKYLLDMRDSLRAEHINNEEAAKQVGQTMFDAFVKPMLSATDGAQESNV